MNNQKTLQTINIPQQIHFERSILLAYFVTKSSTTFPVLTLSKRLI